MTSFQVQQVPGEGWAGGTGSPSVHLLAMCPTKVLSPLLSFPFIYHISLTVRLAPCQCGLVRNELKLYPEGGEAGGVAGQLAS